MNSTKSVNGEVFGNAGSSGGGHRRTQAVFSELSIPLFDSKSRARSLPADTTVTVISGDSANPKAAIMLRPIS